MFHGGFVIFADSFFLISFCRCRRCYRLFHPCTSHKILLLLCVFSASRHLHGISTSVVNLTCDIYCEAWFKWRVSFASTSIHKHWQKCDFYSVLLGKRMAWKSI